MADAAPSSIPAPLIAIAGWLVPGLGYVLIGERSRGLIAGLAILLTFTAGLLIGGIRVIDVPGYDAAGNAKMLRMNQAGQLIWSFRANPTGEVFAKPWYIAQTLAGPINALATWGSLKAGEAGHHQSTARIFDIGTLYTAVAGMLNLLVIIDAAYRATLPPPKEETDPSEVLRKMDEQILADAAAVAESVRKGQSTDPKSSGGQK